MKFKTFSIQVTYGDYNAGKLSQYAEMRVGEWLAKNPDIQVHHFTQSLTDINDTPILQLSFLYS